MTERFQPNNLTRDAQNPYPEGRGKFMPEPGRGEGQSPIKPSKTPEVPSGGQNVDIDKLAGDSRGFPKEVLEKATIELVLKQDLAPEDRIKEAERVLSRSLTVEERNALLEAHNVGKGEVGKDSNEAGLGNYTKAQLLEKARILKEEGFGKAERRMLIEAGLVGESIDATTFPDPFRSIAVTYGAALTGAGGPGSKVPQVVYRDLIQRVSNFLDDPTFTGNVAEGERLLSELYRNYVLDYPQQEGSGRGYFSQEEQDKILSDPTEREAIFESIFVGVDANPGTQYQRALSLEAAGKLDTFLTLLNKADFAGVTDPAEITRLREQLNQDYAGKLAIRQFLHDANWSVAKGGGDVREFATTMSTFSSEYVDLIFEDPLVQSALHMFEQSFQQIKAENGGKLPYENLAWNYGRKDINGNPNPGSDLEDRVWKLMRESIRMRVTGGNGNVPEWRLKRAIVLARGWGVASLRFPEIAAEARLPVEEDMPNPTAEGQRLASIYGEAIARYLDPLEHIIEKFSIGGEDRALLYYFLTGDKSKFQSVDQLRQALEMKSKLKGRDKRLIDVVNLFRTGGPFSRTSWRTLVAMKNVDPEDIRNYGLGIREIRLNADVTNDLVGILRPAVEADPAWAGRSEEEIAEEVKRRINEKGSDGKTLEGAYKEFKRRQIWEDGSKTNPLRIMWLWESKDPGVRERFLSEALGLPVEDARTYLPQIEQDLMVLQEDAVNRLSRGEANMEDRELLRYDLVGGPRPPTLENAQRIERVRQYVETIRSKTSDGVFINSLFAEATDVEGKTPFPFVIGMDDIPFSDMEFINAGGRGFLARRINDFANGATAANELIGLIGIIPKAHDIKPLIEGLTKIKEAVAQYDLAIAMEIMPYLAEGIIRMYDKELVARLPLGIGSVVTAFSDTSFVQEIYTREAMTWKETDKYNFTRHLALEYLLDKKGITKLRKNTGATVMNVALDSVRTYGELALLLAAYQFAKSVGK